MNKPLTSWKKSLAALGYKVNWDAVFRSKKRRALKRQQEELANQHFHVEDLEERQMLSTVPGVNFDSGTLTVTGTENSDNIAISVSSGLVEVSGAGAGVTVVEAADVSSIYVFALAGDDIVDLSGVDAVSFTSLNNVEIHGDDGADTLIGTDGDDTIYGGEGDDTIYGDAAGAPVTLGDITNGIAARDNATGVGHILFTQESVFTRFSPSPHPQNSDHLIAVVQQGDQWFYDNNLTLIEFTPRSTDLLVADVDFTNNTISSLQGQTGFVNGIERGFASGDLVFEANRWGSTNNDGEFRISGTEFFRNSGGDDTIYGGAGNDYVHGGDGDDVISGQAGNDTLYGDDGYGGGAGQDTISGGAGVDKIYGEGGSDTLTGDNGNDFIYGGDDGDTIVGGEGNDFIDGQLGNDYLYGDDGYGGGNGQDHIRGGAGNDFVYGEGGDDVILGQDGNDTLYGDDGYGGGAGQDTISGGAGVDKIYGEGGSDTLTGDNGNDFIYGGDGSDTIVGGEGNDFIDGQLGNDYLYGDDGYGGGNGQDHIRGGAGNDFVYGEGGDDVILGQDGNDTLYGDDGYGGGYGGDTISGGTGVDKIYGEGGSDTLTGDNGNDFIYGGDGSDTIVGGEGNDFIDGQLGNDYLYGDDGYGGGNGQDHIRGGAGNDFVYGEGGDDVILGQSGNDTLYGDDGYGGGYGGDTISGGTGTDYIYGEGGSDTLAGDDGNDFIYGGDDSDTIDGGYGNDVITGGAGNDFITGGDGDDVISGQSGNDTVFGGEGDDRIYGNTGDDVFYGGNGVDRIFGGAGSDYIYGEGGSDTLAGGAGNDYITGGDGDDVISGQSGNDTLYGDDGYGGGYGGDTISGGTGTDYIYGEGGSDTLAGDDGNDFIYGGDDSDTIDGGYGNDVITGGAGNDYIIGGDGDDVISGQSGNDTLYGDDGYGGGYGGDTISGGTGDDYVYGEGGHDTLTGDDGNDFIDAGNESATVIGSDAIFGGAGDNTFQGDNFVIAPTEDFSLFSLSLDRSAILLGDVNQDGSLDFRDISPFIDALSTGDYIEAADINQDGAVNFLDNSPFIGLLTGNQGGDVGSLLANLDQQEEVPFLDGREFYDVFSNETDYTDYIEQADFNQDGKVNLVRDVSPLSRSLTVEQAEAGVILIGDVNQDDLVNFLDISPFISVLSTEGDQTEADINGDGAVNFLDINPFVRLLSGGPDVFQLPSGLRYSLDSSSNLLTVRGTEGNDSINIGGRDGAITIGTYQLPSDVAGVTSIQVSGLDGSDSIDLSNLQVDSFSSLDIALDGGDGHDMIVGSSASDTIIGGIGNDTIYGEGGEDYLAGNAGIDVLDGELPISINGADVRIAPESFGPQDENPELVIDELNRAIQITGNGWKSLEGDFSISENTILRFDYRNVSDGEIHGIGFDNNVIGGGFDVSHYLQLSGSQTFGNFFDAYITGDVDGVTSYEIPLGEFFTGDFSYLVFISDHDVPNPTSSAIFSNLEISDGDAESIAEIRVNTGIALDLGASQVVGRDQLLATAEGQLTTEILFSIASLPANGNLLLNDIEVEVGDSFSQFDLDAGRVAYSHAGIAAGDDSFEFTLNGNDSLAIEFGISVTSIDPTSLIVSGASLTESGVPIELSLELDGVDVSRWEIQWGDDVVDELPGILETGHHIYSVEGNYTVLVTAIVGNTAVGPIEHNVEVTATALPSISFVDIPTVNLSQNQELVQPLLLNVANVDLNNVEFRLVEGSPSGATIDPSTRILTWAGAADVGEYIFTVEAFDSTAPAVVSRITFLSNVVSLAEAPNVEPIAPITSVASKQISFEVLVQEEDYDGSIRYALGSGAPAEAIIHPLSGEFVWTPGPEFAGETVSVEILVSSEDRPTAIVPVAIEIADIGGVFQTPEGDVLVDSVLGASVSGAQVIAVNGIDTSVGQTITLESGASFVVTSSGAFGFDPTSSSRLDQLSIGESFVDRVSILVLMADGTELETSVAIETVGENDLPIAQDNEYTVETGSSIRRNFILVAGLGGRDYDADNETLTAVSFGSLNIAADAPTVFTSALGAQVTVYSDGEFVYDATSINTGLLQAGTILQDSFTYEISDVDLSETSEADVLIEVFVAPTAAGSGLSGLDFALTSSTGFLLFSEESVHDDPRFAANRPHTLNADHFIAVRYQQESGLWEYSDNADGVWFEFTPLSSDRIVAAVDFAPESDVVTPLAGVSANVFGIDAGYVTSDLTFATNTWGTATDPNEIGLAGSFIEFSQPRQALLTSVSAVDHVSDVLLDSEASGLGYLLFNSNDFYGRLDGQDVPSGTSPNFVPVRFDSATAQWQVRVVTDDGGVLLGQWVNFDVDPSDRLVGAIDFDQTSVTEFASALGDVFGIPAGYMDSNLMISRTAPAQGDPIIHVEAGELPAGVNLDAGSIFIQWMAPATSRFVSVGDLGNGIAIDDDVESPVPLSGYVTRTQSPLFEGSFTSLGGDVDHYLIEFTSAEELVNASVEHSIVIVAGNSTAFAFQIDPASLSGFDPSIGEKTIAYRVSAIDSNGQVINRQVFDNQDLGFDAVSVSTGWRRRLFEIIHAPTEGPIRIAEGRLIVDTASDDFSFDAGVDGVGDDGGNFADFTGGDQQINEIPRTSDPSVGITVQGDFTGQQVRLLATHSRSGANDQTEVISVDSLEEIVYDLRTIDTDLDSSSSDLRIELSIAVETSSDGGNTWVTSPSDPATLTFDYYTRPGSLGNVIGLQEGFAGGIRSLEGEVSGVLVTEQVFVDFDFADANGVFDEVADEDAVVLPQADLDGSSGEETQVLAFSHQFFTLQGREPEVRYRVREWSQTENGFLVGDWQNYQFDEIPVPEIQSITTDTNYTSPGSDLPAVKVEGYLVGGDPNGTSDPETIQDVSGVTIQFFHTSEEISDDQLPDGVVVTDTFGQFEYLPASLVHGTNFIQARAISDVPGGEDLVGEIYDFDFLLSEPEIPSFDSTGLTLVNPDAATDDGGVFTTSDPRIQGVLAVADVAASIGLDSVYVEFAEDRTDSQDDDDLIVGTAYPDEDGNFTYSPSTLIGAVTVRGRIVFYDSRTGDNFTSDWSEIDLVVEPQVIDPGTISRLELLNSDDADIPSTSDPILVGSIGQPDGEVSFQTVIFRDPLSSVELGRTSTDEYGNFYYRLTGLSLGDVVVEAVVATWNYDSSDFILGEGEELEFNLVAAPPATISSFDLVNDTGVAGDGITAQAVLRGTVDNSNSAVLVAIDRGEGVEDLVYTDSAGTFTYIPRDLNDGAYTYRARVAIWNSTDGQYDYSDGQTVPFSILTGSGSSAASVTNVGLKYAATPVTNLTITGQVVDAGPFDEVIVEYDLDADDSNGANGLARVERDGQFEFVPAGAVAGEVTIRVRTRKLDESTGTILFSQWQSLPAFDYQPVASSSASITNFQVDSSSSANVSGTVSLADGVEYENVVVELSLAQDGDVVAVVPISFTGHFQYQVANVLPGTDVEVWARARINHADGQLTHSESISSGQFTFEPSVYVSVFGLTEDTSAATGASSTDGVTSNPSLSGTIDVLTGNPSDYSIEVDLNGDQVADQWIQSDSNGNFEISPTVTDGYQSVAVRVTSGSGPSQWQRASFIVDSDDANPAALALASVFASVDSQWQTADTAWSEDTIAEVSINLTNESYSLAESQYSASILLAAQARSAAINASSVVYDQDRLQAEVNYQNSLASARSEFDSNLNELSEFDQTSFEISPFEWPGDPDENAVVIPSDSSQPQPPEETSDGRTFDVDRDASVTAATQEANSDYRQAVEDQEDVLNEEIRDANEVYNEALSEAREQYNQAINDVDDGAEPASVQSQLQSRYDEIENARSEYHVAWREIYEDLESTLDSAVEDRRAELTALYDAENEELDEAEELLTDGDCDHPDSVDIRTDSNGDQIGWYVEACGGERYGPGSYDESGYFIVGDEIFNAFAYEKEREDDDGYLFDQTRVDYSPVDRKEYELAVYEIERSYAPQYNELLNRYDSIFINARKDAAQALATAYRSFEETELRVRLEITEINADHRHEVRVDNVEDAQRRNDALIVARETRDKAYATAIQVRDKAIGTAQNTFDIAVAGFEQTRDTTIANARFDAVEQRYSGDTSAWGVYQVALAQATKTLDLTFIDLSHTRNTSIADSRKTAIDTIADKRKVRDDAAAEKTRALVEGYTHARDTQSIENSRIDTETLKATASDWKDRQDTYSSEREAFARERAEIDAQYNLEFSRVFNKYYTDSRGVPPYFSNSDVRGQAFRGWTYDVTSTWWFGEREVWVDNADVRDSALETYETRRAEITRDRAKAHADNINNYNQNRITAHETYRKDVNAELATRRKEKISARHTREDSTAVAVQTFNVEITAVLGTYHVDTAKAIAKANFEVGEADATFLIDGSDTNAQGAIPAANNKLVDDAEASKTYNVESAREYSQRVDQWAAASPSAWHTYQQALAESEITLVQQVGTAVVQLAQDQANATNKRANSILTATLQNLSQLFGEAGAGGAEVAQVSAAAAAANENASGSQKTAYAVQRSEAAKVRDDKIQDDTKTQLDAFATADASRDRAISDANKDYSHALADDAFERALAEDPIPSQFSELGQERDNTINQARATRAIAIGEAQKTWIEGAGSANKTFANSLADINDAEAQTDQQDAIALAEKIATAAKQYAESEAAATKQFAVDTADASQAQLVDYAIGGKNYQVASIAATIANSNALYSLETTYLTSFHNQHVSQLQSRLNTLQAAFNTNGSEANLRAYRLAEYQFEVAEERRSDFGWQRLIQSGNLFVEGLLRQNYTSQIYQSSVTLAQSERANNNATTESIAEARRLQAIAVVDAEAEEFVQLTTSQAQLDTTTVRESGNLTRTIAEETFKLDNARAAAGQTRLAALAPRFVDLETDQLSDSEYSDIVADQNEIRNNAVEEAERAFSIAVETAEDEAFNQLQEERKSYVDRNNAANLAKATSLNTADLTFTQAVATATIANVQSNATAQTAHTDRYWSAEVAQVSGLNLLRSAVAFLGTERSVIFARRIAGLTADYHVAIAEHQQQVATAALQGSEDDINLIFAAAEADAFVDFLNDTRGDFVDYAGDSARHNSQVSADQASNRAQRNLAITEAERVKSVKLSNLDAVRLTDSANADIAGTRQAVENANEIRLANVRGDIELAEARVDASVSHQMRLRAIDNRDLSFQEASDQRAEASDTYQTALAEAEQKWRSIGENSRVSAQHRFAVAEASRTETQINGLATATKNYEINSAKALLEFNVVRATAVAANDLDDARSHEAQGNRAASSWVDYTTAILSARVQAAQRISNDLRVDGDTLPWGEYLVARWKADRTIFNQTKGEYLQNVSAKGAATVANAQTTFDQVVAKEEQIEQLATAAHETIANAKFTSNQSSLQATRGIQVRVAGAAQTYGVALSSAQYDIRIKEIAGNSDTSAEEARIEDAEDAFETETKSADKQLIDQLAEFERTRTLAEAGANKTLVIESASEQKTLEQSVSDLRFGTSGLEYSLADSDYEYRIHEADVRFSVITNMAEVYESPWAQRDADEAEAQRDKAYADAERLRAVAKQTADANKTSLDANAEAARQQAVGKANAVYDRKRTEAEQAFLAARRNPGNSAAIPGGYFAPESDAPSAHASPYRYSPIGDGWYNSGFHYYNPSNPYRSYGTSSRLYQWDWGGGRFYDNWGRTEGGGRTAGYTSSTTEESLSARIVANQHYRTHWYDRIVRGTGSILNVWTGDAIEPVETGTEESLPEPPEPQFTDPVEAKTEQASEAPEVTITEEDRANVETFNAINAEVGAALAAGNLETLTWDQFRELEQHFYVDRYDGVFDYVYLQIGDKYYSYVEPSTVFGSYKLHEIVPTTVSLSALRQGSELANTSFVLGAADVALSIVPGGATAGYLEEGKYGLAALAFVTDVALTISVVGKAGQIAAKVGTATKFRGLAKAGVSAYRLGKVGTPALTLGASFADAVIAGVELRGAINQAQQNGGAGLGTGLAAFGALMSVLGVKADLTTYNKARSGAVKALGNATEQVAEAKKVTKLADDAPAVNTKKTEINFDEVDFSNFGGCFVPGTQVHLTGVPSPSGVYAGATVVSGDSSSSRIPLQPEPVPQLVAIEDVPLGATIEARNPEGPTDSEIGDWPKNDLVVVSLRARTNDGNVIDSQLLRPSWWREKVSVGGFLPLRTDEIQIVGYAEVLSIESFKEEISESHGNLVTGRFTTYNVTRTVRITIEDGTELEGTTIHPIWNVTHQEFRQMADLNIGDLVDTVDGPRKIIAHRLIARNTSVYNLEVENEHVYRVEVLGVLVHNNGRANPCSVSAAIENGDLSVVTPSRAGATRGSNIHEHHIFPQEFRETFARRGIDVDDFVVDIDVATHQAIHGGGNWRLAREVWDGEWNTRIVRELRDATRRNGGRLSTDQILEIGADLAETYGLGLDFHRYSRATGG